MLERLERDVRKARSDCNLGSVSRLFLSDVLLFEVEGRWWELDNIVGSMAIVEKVYKRSKRWRRNIRRHHNNSFVHLLDLAEPCARSLKRSLLVLKGGGAMSTFGIVIVLCLVLAFIELHRWDEVKAPWVYGCPQIKKTAFLLVLRFLKHLSVIRCYPSPVFQWRRKDGKII